MRLGAANFYELDHLIQNLNEVNACDIIYTTGYFMLSSFEAVKYLAEIGDNKIFAFNISGPIVT